MATTAGSDASAHAAEVAGGERFPFGDNWRDYLAHLDEDRIAEAEKSLRDMLERERLDGLSFLDAGCGSGLFSLAAVRLGARVRSFDFDPAGVGCAQELRRRYAPDAAWEIGQGSVLDRDFLASLGRYDVVYSWGVLHHTGAMWDALANVEPLVAPRGRLFIAIYNDQAERTVLWRLIKRGYNLMPRPLRTAYAVITYGPREMLTLAKALVLLRPLAYVRTWTEYKRSRGMSRWHDILDWVGGYPFEVAKPEEIFDFYRGRGFVLDRLITCRGGLGCNQFVFTRSESTDRTA